MKRVIVLTCLAALQFAQQPTHPLLGRWELNVARTHYGGGAEARTRESFVCERTDAAIRCTTTSVRVGGTRVVASFVARDDGTPGRVRGVDDMDEVVLARVDAFVMDATFRLRGKPVFAYRAVRGDNGKSLTIIAVDPVTRAALHSVVVYDAK